MYIQRQRNKKRLANSISVDTAKPLVMKNAIMDKVGDKMAFGPGLILLMLAFSYSVRSQIGATIDTKTMNKALSRVTQAAYAYKEKVGQKVSAEKLLYGLKGYQDVFDMNVHYQLRRIGVPSHLLKMGPQLGKSFCYYS